MRLLILGRDGVINRPMADGVRRPDEWTPLPGSLEALARLQREGYRVVIATAQPGVAGGVPQMETLNRIHVRMIESVRSKGGQVDAVFVCPHSPEAGCQCRPPRPGLYMEIAERLKINLSSVHVVCATGAEASAAQAAGAHAVLLGSVATARPGALAGFGNLGAFADALITGQVDR
ncbi:MAG: HAD-IIIA family hydrolase [Pseudomonadota bacterium]|nr:HAD-IIIA family hydrolase [Pseudomonadota bacterium]